MKIGKTHGAIGSFITKMRDNKRFEYLVYISIFAMALIIFAATGGISCAVNNKGSVNNVPESRRTEAACETRSIESQERSLAEILSGIRGAGKVKVMITVEKDGVSSKTSDLSYNVYNGGSLFGDGEENAGGSFSISGVIVVAEGAEDIRVKCELTDAVKTLLGIDSGRIGVYVMQP